MKRVLLHVGTPKTGTSYLQDVLFRNRQTLARHDILYPADRFDDHFLAALDLMQLPWGGLEAEAVGAWDRLAAQVRDWPGTSIISHEIFATATPQQIARALDSLGDVELHILLSVRDLARQVPAEWQENIKHRRTLTYADFLQRIRHPERASGIATWFWGAQDVPQILARWADRVPPEQVHLITVPKPGAPRTLLWERFSEAFGLDGLPLELEGERANPSLGVPETALLRRINEKVNDVVEPSAYRPLVRELLAHQTLSRRTKTPRLALPPEDWEWAAGVCSDWREEIERRGYHVVGDLADLQVPEERPPFFDPDHPRERQVNRAALEAIEALLLENARLINDRRHLGEELDRTRVDRDRALEKSLVRAAAERVVWRMERSGGGRRTLSLYRRVRRRNSAAA